jgi:hypothetical protein
MAKTFDVDSFESARQLRDAEVLARLNRLVREEVDVSARLLVHLSETDARGLYREQGCASMHVYCVSRLRMSDAEAYLRIGAARLSRRFPRLLEMFRRQELNLTTIKLLAPVLDDGNAEALLQAASSKTKQELERVLADWFPKPAVTDSMRRLPDRGRTEAASPAQSELTLQSGMGGQLSAASSSFPASASVSVAGNGPPSSFAVGSGHDLGAPCDSEHGTAVCHRGSSLGQLDRWTAARATQPAASHPAACGETPVLSLAPATAHARSEPARDLVSQTHADVVPRGTTHAPSELAVQHACSGAEPSRSDVSSNTATGCRERDEAHTRARLRELGSLNASARCQPLGLRRYKVQFTADQELCDKLKRAQELASGVSRKADIATVVDAALDLLIAKRRRERFGTVANPRAGAGAGAARRRSRYVPRAVKRQVAARDGEQCSFVAEDGHRCEERSALQVDHHNRTYARGGAATAENLRLLCSVHNRLMAQQDYGREHVERKIELARSERRQQSTPVVESSGPTPPASQTSAQRPQAFEGTAAHGLARDDADGVERSRLPHGGRSSSRAEVSGRTRSGASRAGNEVDDRGPARAVQLSAASPTPGWPSERARVPGLDAASGGSSTTGDLGPPR